jgi:hypothetical protein
MEISRRLPGYLPPKAKAGAEGIRGPAVQRAKELREVMWEQLKRKDQKKFGSIKRGKPVGQTR